MEYRHYYSTACTIILKKRLLHSLKLFFIQILWAAGLGASWSPANASIARDFGVTELVARIPQAMYLVGFSLGPVVLTPLAEDYGRKPVYTASMILLYLFQIPIALAPNFVTLAVCRFIGGFVASPIFNVRAPAEVMHTSLHGVSKSCCNIPDLWRSTDEFWGGFALNIWAFAAESIVLAPIWGAYIVLDISWRHVSVDTS